VFEGKRERGRARESVCGLRGKWWEAKGEGDWGQGWQRESHQSFDLSLMSHLSLMSLLLMSQYDTTLQKRERERERACV